MENERLKSLRVQLVLNGCTGSGKSFLVKKMLETVQHDEIYLLTAVNGEIQDDRITDKLVGEINKKLITEFIQKHKKDKGLLIIDSVFDYLDDQEKQYVLNLLQNDTLLSYIITSQEK